MYDHNPFQIAKKMMMEAQAGMPPAGASFKDQLMYVMGGPANPYQKYINVDKKRKHHEEMVRQGKLTQAEFDRLERMGEFHVKEAYDHFEMGPTPEEDPRAAEAEAEDDHKRWVITKLHAFLDRDSNNKISQEVRKNINSAKVHVGPDATHIDVGKHSFHLPHGEDKIKVS